jgi:Pyridoxamine 5'-phosphate oxidase
MPGYGLAVAEESLLPWSWAEARLIANHNYWLSTTSPTGHPHAMPVWAIWHRDALYFSTGAHSRKALNLERSARCVMTTESAAEAVIVEGIGARMSDTPELVDVARFYERKYGAAYPPDSAVYRVTPTKVFGFIEAADQFTETATCWHFDPTSP